MASLMAQGENWDIRALIYPITWPWIIGFLIVFVLSGVLVYFKLRRPQDKSVGGGKAREKSYAILRVGTNEPFAAYHNREKGADAGVSCAEVGLRR